MEHKTKSTWSYSFLLFGAVAGMILSFGMGFLLYTIIRLAVEDGLCNTLVQKEEK